MYAAFTKEPRSEDTAFNVLPTGPGCLYLI